MVNSSVVEYIKKLKEQNISEESIRLNLKTAGWNDIDVNDSFLSLNPNLPNIPQPPIAPPTPVPFTDYKSKIEMWDAFEHFIMFICLLVSSSAISYILHYYINDFLPDNIVGSMGYVNDWMLTMLRFAIASLIVSGPIYGYLFVRVQQKTEINPEIQNMYLRRTLIYITLVITFLTVIGNIICLIYNFLDGKVNNSFILHFFAWILVYGSIFGYYVTQVKITSKKK